LDKEDQFKKNEEDLRNRDDEFNRRIVEYYKHSFENKAKENHSKTIRLDAAEKQKKVLEEENAQSELTNQKLKYQYEELKKVSSKLRKYEVFLTQVKNENSDLFSDINDIVQTYNNLEKNYNDLKKDEEKTNDEIERELKNFKEEKSELETKINSNLTGIQILQGNIKEKKDEKKLLENELNQFEANNNTIESSLESILLAINNIYGKCEEQSQWTQHIVKNVYYDKSDYKKRVDIAKIKIKAMKDYLADYKEIIRNFKENNTNDNK